jgi:hypothetical protein
MLKSEDVILIERVLDNDLGHPDAVPLTAQEQEFFKQRMKDPKFKSHFRLSNQIDAALEDEDAIDLIKKTQSASRGYHKI